MKLLNDFLELEDKKNESTTEMLSYLVNKTFQTYSVIKKKFKFYY